MIAKHGTASCRHRNWSYSGAMMIRPETPMDAEAIGGVIQAAFETAGHSSGTEAAIVEALRKTDALTISLVADDHGRVVGHVAFSPVSIDGRPGDWYGLGPVSVLPSRQRGGIGAAMIRDGLERLEAAGAAGCVVLGDPDYYRRFGFVHDHRLLYGGAPPEYFQRLSFSGGCPAGEVRYHPGFDAG